jgi:hypothetical protein
MPVTLESRLRQIQVFNLDHDAYCGAGACVCSDITTVVLEENPRTGERAPRRITKKAPGAMTLLARERQGGLPDAVLQVPEVRAAIERGFVRIVEQTAVAPQRPAAHEVREE